MKIHQKSFAKAIRLLFITYDATDLSTHIKFDIMKEYFNKISKITFLTFLSITLKIHF